MRGAVLCLDFRGGAQRRRLYTADCAQRNLRRRRRCVLKEKGLVVFAMSAMSIHFTSLMFFFVIVGHRPYPSRCARSVHHVRVALLVEHQIVRHTDLCCCGGLRGDGLRPVSANLERFGQLRRMRGDVTSGFTVSFGKL